MKNNIFWIVLIFFFLVLFISNKPIIKDGTKVGSIRVKGTRNEVVEAKLLNAGFLKKGEFLVINLPEETAAVYKNNRYSSVDYSDNKKLVQYPKIMDTPNCPYGKIFSDALKVARNNPDNLKYYTFSSYYQPTMFQADDKVALAQLDYADTCNMFCIVNPETNHVFVFPGVGQKQADALPLLLEYLKTHDL